MEVEGVRGVGISVLIGRLRKDSKDVHIIYRSVI